MNEAPQTDPAELRRAVRAHLAQRPLVAQNPATIQRSIRRETPCTLGEVSAAAAFLLDLGHLKSTADPLGSGTYYQISATGTLAHERGE